MQIYIANKLAALKQGTSFEYVSENRLFSGSDGYTLTITFPLRGCPQNTAIFGHINRADVTAGKVVFDCEIRDKGFYKFGCITVTEINEAEVKTQFLDGRSEQNFDKTFDKVYINELDLGTPPTTAKSGITPSNAWSPVHNRNEAVALPWVNDASGNIQNCATFADNKYSWHSDTTGLSWQPYLLYITRKICEAVGYLHDFAAWEDKEEYKYLLICNSLPYAWYAPGYERALPHWTVEEYFEKLELFLGCEFDIDHRARRIGFKFSADALAAVKPVRLDNVVEEHSTEVKVEDVQCEYAEAKNLVYKDCDNEVWKYYSCEWFIKSWKSRAKSYPSLREIIAAYKGYATWSGSSGRGTKINDLLYAEDIDCYFIIRAISRKDTGQRRFGGKVIVWQYKCILQPVNLLGPRVVDDADDAPQDEIEFVPAWIDYTDETYGRCLFLAFSGYDEENTYSGRNGNFDWDEHYREMNERFSQSSTVQTLEAGHKEKKAEYYDRIYIGWWDGAVDEWGKLPHPYVENVIIREDWTNFRYGHFSLRINDRRAERSRGVYPVEPSMKTTFKFIADTIPDVRALFLIRGKRYICEKLTATFSEQGMSQLIKGVFYPVKE